MARQLATPDMPAHTPGTTKGEELIQKKGPEPGRRDPNIGRTARDATAINPESHEPIDPRMPQMPPA